MRRLFREILQTALLALVLFSGLQISIQNYRVEGFSMQPTLAEGQYLLVNKLAYYHVDTGHLSRYLPLIDGQDGDVSYLVRPPERGEIVVFRFPNDPSRNFVKRIVAIPGDSIEIRRGDVYVNDQLIDEPYLVEPSRNTIMARTVMGPDEYFVMGDNRVHSNDSRSWGAVPLENIIGRVWVSYWPLSMFSTF